MKSIYTKLFSLFFLILSTNLVAQTNVEWERTYGGIEYEWGGSILQTDDGGYIVIGVTASSDGDVVPGALGADYWIVKLNATNEIEWQKVYGGSGSEHAVSIEITDDGGYIIAGTANSISGDVTGHYGLTDCWLLKLTGDGVIEWEQNYGGSDADYVNDIIQTTDGGYALCGSSWSSDFDLNTNNGERDWWIMKLSASGAIEWHQSLGGPMADQANAIIQTEDGGFACAGHSFSFGEGDFVENFGEGEDDAWIVKLTESGEVEWMQNYGSELRDNFIDLMQTSTGELIAAGFSSNLESTYINLDTWIVKLDILGNVIWNEQNGGAAEDKIQSIDELSTGEFVVAGNSLSTDFYGTYGSGDVLVFKFDTEGNLLWGDNFGGGAIDSANDVAATSDGGFILTGITESDNLDVSANNGSSDLWVVKFTERTTSLDASVEENEFVIFPNPSSGAVALETTETDFEVLIYDTYGRVVFNGISTKAIDLNYLANGMYCVEVRAQGAVQLERLVIGR